MSHRAHSNRVAEARRLLMMRERWEGDVKELACRLMEMLQLASEVAPQPCRWHVPDGAERWTPLVGDRQLAAAVAAGSPTGAGAEAQGIYPPALRQGVLVVHNLAEADALFSLDIDVSPVPEGRFAVELTWRLGADVVGLGYDATIIVVAAAVSELDVDWGLGFAGDEYREACGVSDVSWLTYRSERAGPCPAVTAPNAAFGIGDRGTLYLATEERFNASLPSHQRALAQLESTLALRGEEQQSPWAGGKASAPSVPSFTAQLAEKGRAAHNAKTVDLEGWTRPTAPTAAALPFLSPGSKSQGAQPKAPRAPAAMAHPPPSPPKMPVRKRSAHMSTVDLSQLSLGDDNPLPFLNDKPPAETPGPNASSDDEVAEGPSGNG